MDNTYCGVNKIAGVSFAQPHKTRQSFVAIEVLIDTNVISFNCSWTIKKKMFFFSFYVKRERLAG